MFPDRLCPENIYEHHFTVMSIMPTLFLVLELVK